MPQNRISKGAAFLLCVVESASDVPTNQTSRFVRSTYNKANQLIESYNSENDTTTTYTYDVLGNMLTDGSKTYTYNIRGQQATFTDGETSSSYTYYYDGLRKSKSTNGVTTYFIWHNGNMVYEFTTEDETTYTYGLRLISSDDYTYVLNAHGDVVALLDASGNVTKRYDYDAFGNELNLDANDTNPFRYCGEYFDRESGTFYLRARYYSPTRGRFSTVDPIKDGLNWYAYCGNSPVVFVDPWGLIPTNEESALISKHIYDYDESDTEDNRTVSGWRLIDVKRIGTSVKVGVYIRSNEDWQSPSEYVIAFRGSSTDASLETVAVWSNNIAAYSSDNSIDLYAAMVYANIFILQYPDKEVTFTGHSKGGGEAIAAAAATGKNAITFNAAAFAFSKYGLEESELSNINNYYVESEILSSLIGPSKIGTTHYIPSQYWHEIVLPGFVEASFRIPNYIDNHSISAFIKYYD